MYLTPIKNGEQIVWLKENGRERTGDEYEDFMKGLEMSDCSITSEESKISKTENRPPVSIVGQKQTLEGHVEPEFTSQTSIKRRSEQKQQKLQENEDTLEENVNEESVRGRRMISEKTIAGSVEYEFTSESRIKNKSEQKQRKLQKNEDTLEENVNEEIRGESRMISEKTSEENEQLKFTSQSPIKNRSEQKQRKLQQIEDRLEENVNGEIMVDRRMISEKTTEGNVELKSTPQSPSKKRSVQKQRKLEQSRGTLKNNNEESVSDGRVISENTTEGNVGLELTSQSPIKKRSEQKQARLLGSEETLEENVNQESVDERGIISEKTLEGNGSTSQSLAKKKRSDRKRRKVEDNDTLEENVNEESADERRITSERTLEGNERFQFTSPSPIRKRSEQKQRKLRESEVTLEESVNQESVDGRGIISEKTLEGNGRLQFTSPSPSNRRSEQKQRKLRESEDTLVENVNEESVVERRIMSEKTLEGNGRFEFTSRSPSNRRSEQKQQKLQDSEDTLVENDNELSVDERRIISEKTLEGNGTFEFTSPSPIKKRSEQKQRKLRDSEDSLEENVNEESVDEKRIISEKTLEGNGRFEFTSPSPSKRKSEQKQQKLRENEDTLEENVNEESVDERGIISGKTLERNVRFEFTSPSPSKKRSEQEQQKLQESEDTLEKTVNEESVDERGIVSEKTLEGNGRFEFTSPSPSKKRSEQKQRKLLDSEDTVGENVNEESVDERGIISEKTLEGNGRFEFTSSSPIKKRSEQKQRKPQNLQESEDTLVENVNDDVVDERKIMSEKTLEGSARFEFTSPSPSKKRSEQKQQKLQECEDTMEENVYEESLSDTAITSKKRLQNNVELECAAKDQVSNNNSIKITVERKGAKRKWGVLRESDSQASVGMETPKKLAREDGYCEDKQNEEYKKTYNGKTLEGANNISDGLKEGNQIEALKKNKKKKKRRKKRKEKSELCGTESTPESTPTSFLEDVESSESKDQQDGPVEREFASNVKHQISNAKAKKKSDCDLLQKQDSLAFLGEKNFKKKDRYWKEKRSENDEKSNDRKTGNEEEKVNNGDDQFRKEIYAQQSEKKKKRKEKRRKDELNSTGSASEIPSSPTLERVTSASLNDSGYCENGHNKSKQHQQCVPDQDESVHQPRISKKRKAVANHEKEIPSGQGLLI